MDLSTLEERLHDVRLNINQADGQVLQLGHAGARVDWHIHLEDALRSILKRPQYALGSSYVRGEWDIDTRQLPMLIQALIPRTSSPTLLERHPRLRRLRARLPRVRRKRSQPLWRNFSPWLSRICLGEELFQVCGHYREPGTTPQEAQRLRCRDLMARLQLAAGQHVLDLDAGWGALALYLAEHAGVRVTALVSGRDQLHYAHDQARRRGLDGSVHFRLGGFCQCRGHFDRILAGGFLQRHAEPAYPVLLRNLQALLRADGMIWLQVTGRNNQRPVSNRWYLEQLPDGHSLPLLFELGAAVEQTGLRTLLTEDLSDFLLRDLESQATRYHGKRAAISQRFGESWTRHWEFLLASEISALAGGQLRRHQLILGNVRCRWPTSQPSLSDDGARLPVEIARTIPGLARDI